MCVSPPQQWRDSLLLVVNTSFCQRWSPVAPPLGCTVLHTSPRYTATALICTHCQQDFRRQTETRVRRTQKTKQRHTPSIASLLYPFPWLVGASAMETRTILSFQTESLMEVEAWGTLTAPYTLLPALADGCNRSRGLGRCTGWGTGGHTVWKHLTSGTDTGWKERRKHYVYYSIQY